MLNQNKYKLIWYFKNPAQSCRFLQVDLAIIVKVGLL